MPTPSSIVSFTTPTASNSAGESMRRTRGKAEPGRLDQTSSPGGNKASGPATLVTRAASFRYGGRLHSGIPGGIIPLYPGDFVGIGRRVRRNPKAGSSARPFIERINNQILTGEFYKALKEARKLIAYEKELLDHASCQQSLRGNRQRDSEPA